MFAWSASSLAFDLGTHHVPPETPGDGPFATPGVGVEVGDGPFATPGEGGEVGVGVEVGAEEGVGPKACKTNTNERS